MNTVDKIRNIYKAEGVFGTCLALGKKIVFIGRRRETRFPLRKHIRTQIINSLERSATKLPTTLIKTRSVTFPTVEELFTLWPILLSQQRAIFDISGRHGDFDPKTTYLNIQQGRKIQKNLFEIWIFLREDPAVILEIGCRSGQSLVNKMVFHTQLEKATIFCLDLFIEGGSKKIIRRNLEYFGVPTKNFFFFQGDSKKVVPSLITQFPGLMFDYVLVDGSHHVDDAYRDLVNIIPYIRPGGWLVFDDTGPVETGDEGYGLIDVWDKVMESYDKKFNKKHYDVPYGFCVAQKLQ